MYIVNRNGIYGFLIALCPILLSTSYAPAEENDSSGEELLTPVEISRYYDDHNFIVSYSTPSERDRIRKIRDYGELALLSERLERIGINLRSLDEKILRVDSGIYLKLDRSHLLLPELNEITGIREAGENKILVDVLVRPLSPYENAHFIAEYDNSDIKDTLPQDNLKLHRKHMLRKEIHQWIKVDDNWMKGEVNIMLIDY